jgi:arsenite/tail-anchored protein-transporting ATPase
VRAGLVLEEHDAAAHARRWLEHATGHAAALIEAGTLLDAADVAGFTRLALPGVDELMAVLRLTELEAGGARVVVDTAPTGHALRLLDAAETHDGMARALQAMADKAGAVMSSFAGRPVRLQGEALIDELDATVRAWRRLLAGAAFVVVTRDEEGVRAETMRLHQALRRRRLRIAATVVTGAEPRAAGTRRRGRARAGHGAGGRLPRGAAAVRRSRLPGSARLARRRAAVPAAGGTRR